MKESRIWKRRSPTLTKNVKTVKTNPTDNMTTRTKAKAVVTGFHSETSEAEVQQLLKETITERGMSIENAFIYLKSDDETNKSVRSANILKKKVERKEDKDGSVNGRRRKISSEKNGICQILHPHEGTDGMHYR